MLFYSSFILLSLFCTYAQVVKVAISFASQSEAIASQNVKEG